MKGCYFCGIVKKEVKAPIAYEDKDIQVVIADNWIVKGHLYIVWKQHKLNLSDLSEEEYQRFSNIVHKSEKALLEVLNKKRAIILKSGGLEPHFHFHIYAIDLNTTWQEIKDIFDMKTKYKISDQEKEEFIDSLKEKLN